MTMKKTKREQRKIKELAREYSEKGYRVSIEPHGQKLPKFLRKINFVPDLIAESDTGSSVIEVSSKATVDRLRELSTFVETIEKRPGWSFELVMTNPQTTTPAAAIHGIPQLDDLQDSFEKLSALLILSRESDNDFSHAVLLSAWAIVEGALRMYLFSDKAEIPVRNSRSIVRDAVMFGFISANEGKFLDSVAQFRNSIAHGAVETKIPDSLLNRLVELCKSLIKETESKKRDI